MPCADAARAAQVELVHREGEHVGRARLVHPPDVQLLHLLDVDEQQRQLGERAHAEPVEHVARDAHERLLVDLDAALVGDLDAHRDRAGRRRAGPRARRRALRPRVASSASYCA